jgi:hypothetical protein
LRDTITESDVSALNYVVYMGKLFLIGITLIFGIPLTLLAIFRGLDFWAIPFVYTFFGVFGLIFVSLQAIIGVRSLRKQLPRVIAVESDRLKFSYADEQYDEPLQDCRWSLGSTQYDPVCWFTKFRHGITIELPGGFFGCGFNPATFEIWRGFLMLARVPYRKRMHWSQVAFIGLLSVIAGALIGWYAGSVVGRLLQNPDWRVVGAILGIVELPLITYLYYSTGTTGTNAMRSQFRAWQIALPFFAVGFMVGSPGGWTGRIICGLFNGTIGVAVGWLLQRRMAAAEFQLKIQTDLGTRVQRDNSVR